MENPPQSPKKTLQNSKKNPKITGDPGGFHPGGRDAAALGAPGGAPHGDRGGHGRGRRRRGAGGLQRRRLALWTPMETER